MKDSINFVEVLITVRYEIIEGLILQTFSYNKKYKKYLKDSRYILQGKFERKIREMALEDLSFVSRVDEDSCVKLFYRQEEIDLKNTIFKIVDFVPPNPGCDYCIKAEEGDYIFCKEKNKLLTEPIKNCKIFRQKVLYKS